MHTRHMSIWETAHKQCLEMGGLFKKLENACYIQDEPIRFAYYNGGHLVTVQHFLSVLWQHLTHISLLCCTATAPLCTQFAFLLMK